MKNILFLVTLGLIISCKEKEDARKPIKQVTTEDKSSTLERKVNTYISFKLTSDLSVLSESEQKMLPLLIKAANIMNELFWYDAYGDKKILLDSVQEDFTKKFIEINYGPWDRLDGNSPFVEGVKAKPLGANFYPKDMTKAEFETFSDAEKTSQYTFIRRNEEGQLITVPYYKQFESQIKKVLADNEVTLIGGNIDEAPMAYKNIHTVMNLQTELVEVLGTFTPKIVRMDR